MINQYVWAVALFVPGLIYALAGLRDAYKKGEKIQWSVFFKTVVLSAVSSGLLSQLQADTTLEFLAVFTGNTVLVTWLDKAFNAVIKKIDG